MKKQPTLHGGFSMVEVAIALGVAAFALVAIIGLIPVGLSSNQASIEQTAAAGLAAGVVADLRAAKVEYPPTAQTSLRWGIPLATSGSAMHTIFLREDGSASGSVDADADINLDPRYRVTLFIDAPGATQKDATKVRILVTWPALADTTAGNPPTKFLGSYEVVTALNRN